MLKLDLAMVPKGWEVDKWLYYAKVNHIAVIDSFKDSLSKELGIDEETIANYVIKTSYNSFSISKSFS